MRKRFPPSNRMDELKLPYAYQYLVGCRYDEENRGAPEALGKRLDAPVLGFADHDKRIAGLNLAGESIAAAPGNPPAGTAIDPAGFEKELSAVSRKKDAAKGASFAIFRPSLIKVRSKIYAEDEYDDMPASDIEKASRRRHAALIGTMVHRMMEILVSAETPVDDSVLAAELAAEFGVFGDEGTAIEGQIQKAAARMKQGGYPQKNGVPRDRLKELAGAEDLDERYQSQLKAYQYAFFRMSGEKADARVYHLEM